MALSMEVPNPANIETSTSYLIAGVEEPYARLVLGDFNLDGRLFQYGTVEVGMNSVSGKARYSFQTTLYPGMLGWSRDDLGFYTPERVSTVQNLLTEQGVLSEVKDSGRWEELTNLIVKGEADNGIVIGFGFKSHKDSGDDARGRIDFLGELGKEYRQRQLERAIRRANQPNVDYLRWHMTNPHNPVVADGYHWSYELADNKFRDHLAYFTETSLTILRALYQEAQLNEPDRKITLLGS